MPVQTRTFSAQQTEDLGSRLALARPVQLTFAVLYLCGELGSGKTTFARGFVRGCGIGEPVRSPTYTLLEPYATGALSVLHLDLYRLRDSAELETLGLREYAGPAHLWLIEWPERGGTRLPPPDLQVEFAVAAAGHDIAMSARTPGGRSWLEAVA